MLNLEDPRQFQAWQQEVRDRFFDSVNSLLDLRVVKSEGAFADRLLMSRSNFGDFKKLRRFITTKMLYLSWKEFGIDPSYILCGKGQVKTVSAAIETSPVSEQHTSQGMNPENKFSLIRKAYQEREPLYSMPSINPMSFRKVVLINDLPNFREYVRSRAVGDLSSDYKHIYINGDPREISIIGYRDFVSPSPTWLMRQLLFRLMPDPFWFWPHPNFLYVVCLADQSILTGILEGTPSSESLLLISEEKPSLRLNRQEIQAIWRIERSAEEF
jgi:hypothetical protein